MHQRLLLAVFTTLLQLASSSHQANKSLRCGKDHNNKLCPPSMCCSGAGYCGITEEYCSVPGNCQEKFGLCDSFLKPSGASVIGGKRKFNDAIPAIVHKCSKPKTLALSFDDGPSQYTNEVLDVLAEYGARATFFLGGIINGRGTIDKQWAPVVKRMVMEGHQIGSHSWSHPNFDKLTSAERKAEMYKNERAIVNVIGKMPTFMRPPMIICNEQCQKDMKELGYHIVNWEYDSQDWKIPQPTIDEEVASLSTSMNKIPKDGNMFIIQHDTGPNAAAVTRAILEHIKPGWMAVPLVECLDHSLDHAYQFPQYLEYESSAKGGCLVSGPGACIMPKPFNSKDSCENALHMLENEVSACHQLSGNLVVSHPIKHCHFGQKIAEDLCEFCNDCGKKNKPACNSKSFVWKGTN